MFAPYYTENYTLIGMRMSQSCKNVGLDIFKYGPIILDFQTGIFLLNDSFRIFRCKIYRAYVHGRIAEKILSKNHKHVRFIRFYAFMMQ